MTWLWCLAVLCWATGAAGQPGDRTDELARRHFEAGAAYLEQADYDAALREFKRAHELSGRAEILINVATVHERLGQPAKAIDALERYLEAAPEGEHAETVRMRISNLEKRVEPEAPPPAAPATGEQSPSESAGTSSTADPDAQPPSPPAAAQPEPDEPEPPFWESERLPAYILFSVAGVSTAGALLTGGLASKEHSDAEDRCAPRCTDDQVSAGKRLAVTSTVLTGAAVVSATIGAVLFFELGKKEDSADESAARPTLQVGAGPGGANATAKWRF